MRSLPLERIRLTENDTPSQYSRCYSPTEVSVETEFEATLCIEDGPIYEYVENQVVDMTVVLHYDPPSASGIQVRSKTYQIPIKRSGAFFELLRNHPERVEQWCRENQS